MRGLVISDLHLMASRSVGMDMLPSILIRLKGCDALVLNGDTFDFRWSTHPGEVRSIEVALATIDCYFGHTHIPFRGHHHEGVEFHNTGSAIRGMGFQPLEFEWQDAVDPTQQARPENKASAECGCHTTASQSSSTLGNGNAAS